MLQEAPPGTLDGIRRGFPFFATVAVERGQHAAGSDPSIRARLLFGSDRVMPLLFPSRGRLPGKLSGHAPESAATPHQMAWDAA
ncbi:MAG: hypothetical protein M3547_13290, partial [Acidobacteriota bacterium]|nr:hypothetical protein [Acidobacteriota bacterium]